LVKIESIVYTNKFERDVRKIKDNAIKERLEKQIRKIVENPDSGKPLKYGLKGEWTVKIKPYRLIYAVHEERLILLRFEHCKEVYGS
jgi:addiction module RelE/StbE family toxin